MPILRVLQRQLQNTGSVLEIGGGTGQHAVFFARALPHLNWQSSDAPDMVATLALRIADSALANLADPLTLDVNQQDWEVSQSEAVFTANTLHIIGASSVENFFRGVGRVLPEGGLLLVYGPFKYAGEFTTESNARFDDWLRQRDPASGIRDFEWVDSLAEKQGLQLLEDNAMPANNQLLVWKRVTV